MTLNIFVVSMASSNVIGGSIVGTRFASKLGSQAGVKLGSNLDQ
jgi:hypothetical protein